MDFRKQQPFQKALLFFADGNRGRVIFSQAGQSISNAGKQKRGKYSFSHTQSQHKWTLVPWKI